MKKRVTFLLYLCLANTTLAQTTLQGSLQDTLGKPLPFASITLHNVLDSSLVKGTLSTQAGQFAFTDLRAGHYRITATMIGYISSRSGVIRVADRPVTWPALTLREAIKTLGEVNVTAQKPLFEQKMDMLVVNVQSSITAQESSALDVLERSPGVQINRQQNALSLLGKAGVTIMINGKISRLPPDAVMQQLAGMNASNIEKIELISSPSARYDAEGDAGIINIVLKKNLALGTNGTYTLTAGYGFHEKPAGSINLNHRSERLNLFGDASALYNHQQDDFYVDRQFTNDGVQNQYGSFVRHQPIAQNYTTRLGLDYTLGSHTTLGGLAMGFVNRLEYRKNTQITLDQNGVTTQRNQFTDNEVNRWLHGMLNLNLRHNFGKGHLVSLDADRLYYDNHNPHQYVTTLNDLTTEPSDHSQPGSEAIRTGKLTPIRMWVLKADYSHSLGASIKLEAGVKSTSTHLTNDVLVSRLGEKGWQPDPTFSQHYALADDIRALYTSLNYTLSARTKLQAGLRFEHTQTYVSTADNPALVSRTYGSLFPSVFLSHDLSKSGMPPTHSLQVSYSRRIQRPDYTLLAPWVLFVDPQTFVTGNPALLPTFTDGVQTTYRFHSHWLLTLNYSHDRNALDRFRARFDSTRNQNYVTPQNVRSFHTVSVSVSLPLVLTPWWRLQTNLMGIWQQATTELDGGVVSYQNQVGRVNQSHSFTLPKGFTGELTVFYQSASLWGLSKLRPLGSVNVGIQKKFTDKNSSLALSITDLFWTNQMKIDTYYSSGVTGGYGFRNEPRVVRLSFTRHVGSQTVKKTSQRETGSEEERNRIKATN